MRTSDNIFEQNFDINKAERSKLKTQKPFVIWFVGLSGAGKSTTANALEKRLYDMGKHTYLLDGDNIRNGLSKDLGFGDFDRKENLRRVAELSKLMVDAGLIVLTAFISPFEAERQMARDLFADDEFIEVFVDAPLEVIERLDPKGLYKKARAGQIKKFTGIDSPFEQPYTPEIYLQSHVFGTDELVNQIIDFLHDKEFI